MDRDVIETVDQLAEAFGGTGAFAEWADVVPSAISNWRQDGSIPRGYHFRIYLHAFEQGWRLSPRLFGMTTFGAAEAIFRRRRPRKETSCTA